MFKAIVILLRYSRSVRDGCTLNSIVNLSSQEKVTGKRLSVESMKECSHNLIDDLEHPSARDGFNRQINIELEDLNVGPIHINECGCFLNLHLSLEISNSALTE